MSIVLNENDWALDKLNERSLGKKPSETLRRVARYYMDNGCTQKEARKQLDIFLLMCEPASSLPKWADALDYAVSKAAKFEAIHIDDIAVTDKEMAIIDSLDGKQIRRLAFTLLCLAKYWNTVNPAIDGWVSNKDNEIMSMANINTSLKRQSIMYKTLRDAGLIQFSRKVDNTSVRVCFITDGTPVIHISDFRNLGYQYLMYHGEPYYQCANCGLTTKLQHPSNTGGSKYCPECAVRIHAKQKVDSVMRKRALQKC